MLPKDPITFTILLAALGLLTSFATLWDQRYFKIPNKLTLPFFGAGLVYQCVFNGLPGLGDASLGFLVGFGTLFVLWMIGGGGAGDAKLMGALSVWLGFKLTLYVLILSTCVALLMTIFFYFVVKPLFYPAELGENKDNPKSNSDENNLDDEPVKHRKPELTFEEKAKKRPITFSFSVALATWAVVLIQLLKASSG